MKRKSSEKGKPKKATRKAATKKQVKVNQKKNLTKSKKQVAAKDKLPEGLHPYDDALDKIAKSAQKPSWIEQTTGLSRKFEHAYSNPTMEAILGISRNLGRIMDPIHTPNAMMRAVMGGSTMSEIAKIMDAQESIRKLSAPMDAVFGMRNIDLLTQQVRENVSAYNKFLNFSNKLNEVLVPKQIFAHALVIPALANPTNYIENKQLNAFDILSGSTFWTIQEEFGNNAIESIDIAEIVDVIKNSSEFKDAVQQVFTEQHHSAANERITEEIVQEKIYEKAVNILFPILHRLGLDRTRTWIVIYILWSILKPIVWDGPLENALASDNTEEITAVVDERSQRIIDSTNVKYNELKKSNDNLSEKVEDLSELVKEMSGNPDFLIQDAWVYEKHNLKSKKLHLLKVDASVDIIENIKGWVQIKAILVNGHTIEGWIQKKSLNGFQ